MKTETYFCENKKGDWVDFDYYTIAPQSEKSRKYAIWRSNMWIVSGIKSFKRAIEILNSEFENVNIAD